MNCGKCGLDNPRGAKFCNQCGAPLLQSKADIDHYRMVQHSIPQALRNKITAASIEGERKHVTVLFADISGFTALSEKLDPEEVTDLVNRCFKGLIDAIFRYEGTIDKFIGDCIMAIFGAPVTHEDDPERAVHAALDILSAIDHFNELNHTGLSIHIGINCGEVVAGIVGSDLRMDYTVMGDTVNLASRLLDLAKDEIIVSESVRRKVSYLFELQELAPVRVKGKAGKVKPYRVIGIREVEAGKRGQPGISSSLVGRSQELVRLKRTMEHVGEGAARILAVIGDAGIGKSRLIEEVRDYGAGAFLWLQGRSSSYGRALPFGVILDQVRRYFRIDVRDHESKGAMEVTRASESLFGEATPEYLPYLLSFLSINIPQHLESKVRYLDMENLHLQEFVAIKALYREIAGKIPVVLYFEDLQWMDAESMRLLEFLLDGLRDTRMLFLFESRPEKGSAYYALKPSIKKIYGTRFTEIDLRPLNAQESSQLISNCLRSGRFPEQVRQIILEKSEGNPFYIEEIIRSFTETGRIKELQADQRAGQDVAFGIPESVDAVIRSRIDSLPPHAKEILTCASVIGRAFYSPILACLSGKEETDVSLKILEAGEFIKREPSAGSDLMEDDEMVRTSGSFALFDYSFKHTLIREVSYNGLLKKRRKQLHARIAEYIEERFAKEIEHLYETLAVHYFHAEAYGKSYDYYRKAGDAARKLYLHAIAIERYEKALELHDRVFAGRKGEMGALLESMGDAQVIQADYPKALDHYADALASKPPLEKRAELTMKKGNVLSYLSEYDGAIAAYEEAIAMLSGKRSSTVYFDTLLNFAALLSLRKSDHDRAEKMTQDVLAKTDVGRELLVRAKAFSNLGVVAYNRGDYDQAMKYYEKTLEIYERMGDKKGIAASCRNLGVVYSYRGELDRALEYYNKQLDISDTIGDRREIGSALNNMGIVYWNRGNLDAALGYYQRHLTISEEIGDKRGIGAACNNIGLILWKKGDLDEALRSFKKYLSISEEIGFETGIGRALGNIGGVYHYKGELDTALTYYKRHLDIAGEIGIKQEIGVATYNIGCVYRDRGDFDRAIEYFERYERSSESMGYKLGVGFALAGLGNVSQELGKYGEAKRFYERAEVITEAIGDKVLLSNIYGYQAQLRIALQDYAAGQRFAEKGLELARAARTRAQEIPALRALGKSMLGQDARQGLQFLGQSISLARKQMMKYELAVSLYEMARALADRDMVDEARVNLQESKGIFRRAAAKHWMRRIKAFEDQIN